jgi:uncharacterized membrane protein YccC
MSRKDLALIGVAALCLIALLAVRLLPYGVLLSLIGVLLGAAISAGLSWYFYQQSSEDLRNEAERLRRYNEALTSYLDAAGVIQPGPRDKAGDPIPTVTTKMKAASLEARGESAEVTVDEDKPPEGKGQEGD